MRTEAQTRQLKADSEKLLETFQKLIDKAGLNAVKMEWDDYNFDFGTFKFEDRNQAVAFCQILPDGFVGEVLGQTSSVTVDLI